MKAMTVRKYKIIGAISEMRHPSMSDLSEQLGMPAPTIKQVINGLRAEYGMQINYVRLYDDVGEGRGGSNGYYEIRDWGVIAKSVFKERYGSLWR